MEMMELKIKLTELVNEMDSLVNSVGDASISHSLIMEEFDKLQRLISQQNNRKNKYLLAKTNYSPRESIYIPNFTEFRYMHG